MACLLIVIPVTALTAVFAACEVTQCVDNGVDSQVFEITTMNSRML